MSHWPSGIVKGDRAADSLLAALISILFSCPRADAQQG